VLWQLNGNKSDRLHKIGQGTLIINATGSNPGELSVGDGTVILDQQADKNANKLSFENIDIVSGRPTLTLSIVCLRHHGMHGENQMNNMCELQNLIARAAQARSDHLIASTVVTWLLYLNLSLRLGRRAFSPWEGIICLEAVQAMIRLEASKN